MTNPTKVPFLDLVTPHRELEQELLEVVKKAFSNAGFIGGPMVEEFEKEFAAFCSAKHCVGVNSGTDALRFALMAVGTKPGEIIITVPHTFIATTEAITQAGAQISVCGYSRGYLHTRSREAPRIPGNALRLELQ
jgi:dTDP-4-amino-4,6-dideoxygalactose transaminase